MLWGIGYIDSESVRLIKEYICFQSEEVSHISADFQKIACDVNDDGEVNWEDMCIIPLHEGFLDGGEINQNRIAKKSKRYYKELQEYIAKLDKTTGYTFEYNDETDTYKLKGVKAGTTVADLIKALPEDDRISINGEKETTNTVETGMHIRMTIQENYEDMNENLSLDFANIEIEK